MKINVCDICHAQGRKIVESDYRWGYKGGFKLDLCEHHAKKGNPFKGMKEKDAEAAYYKMRFGTDEPTEKALMDRLANAGDNVPKEARR